MGNDQSQSKDEISVSNQNHDKSKLEISNIEKERPHIGDIHDVLTTSSHACKIVIFNNTPYTYFLKQKNLSEESEWIYPPPKRIYPKECHHVVAICRSEIWDQNFVFKGRISYAIKKDIDAHRHISGESQERNEQQSMTHQTPHFHDERCHCGYHSRKNEWSIDHLYLEREEEQKAIKTSTPENGSKGTVSNGTKKTDAPSIDKSIHDQSQPTYMPTSSESIKNVHDIEEGIIDSVYDDSSSLDTQDTSIDQSSSMINISHPFTFFSEPVSFFWKIGYKGFNTHTESPKNIFAKCQSIDTSPSNYVPVFIELRENIEGIYSLDNEKLLQLVEETNFEKFEIQDLYISFCNFANEKLCIDFTRFSDIFQEISNNILLPSLYNAFKGSDHDVITFDQFICVLSAITRGDALDKAKFAYALLDYPKKGSLEYDSLLERILIVSRFMAMLGFDKKDYNDPYEIARNMFIEDFEEEDSGSSDGNESSGYDTHSNESGKATERSESEKILKKSNDDNKETMRKSQSETLIPKNDSKESNVTPAKSISQQREFLKQNVTPYIDRLHPGQVELNCLILENEEEKEKTRQKYHHESIPMMKEVIHKHKYDHHKKSSNKMESTNIPQNIPKIETKSSSTSKGSASPPSMTDISPSLGTTTASSSPSETDILSIDSEPSLLSTSSLDSPLHPTTPPPTLTQRSHSISYQTFIQRFLHDPDCVDFFGFFDYIHQKILFPTERRYQLKFAKFQQNYLAGWLEKDKGESFFNKTIQFVTSRDRRWFVVKDGFMGYSRKPNEAFILVIPLWDVTVKTYASDPTSFRVESSQFSRTLYAPTPTEAKQWVDFIRSMTKRKHRYLSYAPVRNDAHVQWYVNGKEYFEDLLPVIENTKHRLFISGWYLSPGLYLIRGDEAKVLNRRKNMNKSYQSNDEYHDVQRSDEEDKIEKENGDESKQSQSGVQSDQSSHSSTFDPQYRLDNVLLSAAKRGVSIYLLFWNAPLFSFDLKSSEVCLYFNQLHSNIHAIQHPNTTIPMLWAHHQKMVVSDDQIAFLGGIDICYGRYEDDQYDLVDAHETKFPGRDYCNLYIKDETNGIIEDDLIDRKREWRMPWHDIQCLIQGNAAKDVSYNFLQRWNKAVRDGSVEYKVHYLFPWIVLKDERKKSNGIANKILNDEHDSCSNEEESSSEKDATQQNSSTPYSYGRRSLDDIWLDEIRNKTLENKNIMIERKDVDNAPRVVRDEFRSPTQSYSPEQEYSTHSDGFQSLQKDKSHYIDTIKSMSDIVGKKGTNEMGVGESLEDLFGDSLSKILQRSRLIDEEKYDHHGSMGGVAESLTLDNAKLMEDNAGIIHEGGSIIHNGSLSTNNNSKDPFVNQYTPKRKKSNQLPLDAQIDILNQQLRQGFNGDEGHHHFDKFEKMLQKKNECLQTSDDLYSKGMEDVVVNEDRTSNRIEDIIIHNRDHDISEEDSSDSNVDAQYASHTSHIFDSLEGSPSQRDNIGHVNNRLTDNRYPLTRQTSTPFHCEFKFDDDYIMYNIDHTSNKKPNMIQKNNQGSKADTNTTSSRQKVSPPSSSLQPPIYTVNQYSPIFAHPSSYSNYQCQILRSASWENR